MAMLHRTWTLFRAVHSQGEAQHALQQELPEAATDVLIEALDDFPDFVQYWKQKGLGRLLRKIDLESDEFLLALEGDEDTQLVVTNRQLVYSEAAGGADADQGQDSYQLSDIAAYARVKGKWYERDHIEITLHTGQSITYASPVREAIDTIAFAHTQIERDWSQYQQVDGEVRDAELAAARAKLAEVPTVAANAQEESDSDFDISGPIIGVCAAIFFLLVNGAPLFEGGPAFMRWLSRGGNEMYLFGAIALGFLSPMFMPRS